MTFWTRHNLTIILALSLTLLSIVSLLVGVLDFSRATIDTWELLLISRLPRLLAIIMAGMGLHGAFFREVKRKGRREAGVSASVVSASAVPATAVPGENGGIEERISTERRPLPGEPIPNPLPGPKKHERREMDYAFEPGEDRMFFDIDRVEEGDDFDYQ